MCMADNEILPASCTWVFPTMGIMQFNKNATDRAKEDIKAAMKTLNDHLLTRTYLVGESVTLADIAVACTLLNLYKQVMDPNFRKPFMNVTRWFTTVINQPNAKGVLGAVALCSKMAEFDAKKFAEFSGKGAGDKKGKEKAPKAEKKKEPEKKKERKKNLPVMKYPWNLRRKTPWMLYPRVLLILRNGRGFIPTMTRILPSHGSGSILTMKITPSGEATTSTMMSSPWSSCLAISSAVCSSA